MRNVILSMASLASASSALPTEARKAPEPTWQVTRSSDPITGATSCVVTAYDQAAGMSFSRSGVLYPFVEKSSVHGILVGVSSGGRFRLPTGDIVWRVDDKPFRTLTAADNPGATAPPSPSQAIGMQQLVDQQMRLIAAATVTSTVASGATATAMLAEMLSGTGLIYRAAASTDSFGLPGGAGKEVGQITRDGLRPIPLDDSFRSGLAACQIALPAGE